MNEKSQSSVALITGCGRGIARHLTTVMAKKGYRILATDVNLAALEKCAEELNWPSNRVMLQKLDVRSTDQWIMEQDTKQRSGS